MTRLETLRDCKASFFRVPHQVVANPRTQSTQNNFFLPSAEGQEVLIVVVGGTFGYFSLLLGGRLAIIGCCWGDVWLFFFLPLAFLRLLPMLTLNFGIPRTFLVLLNTFENILH